MSFKTYDSYKESGIAWLGKVPATWKVAAMKHGFDIKLGKMLQPDLKGKDDTLAPYIRAANIQWKGVDASDVKLMWFSPQERAELTLQENDLLVSEGGDVGRACLWRNELEECYFQNSVNRARSKPGNSPDYGRYWLSTLKNKGFIDVLCNKSTIAHYTAEKLAATPALLPPHSEQVAIASFLDRETAKIDALIAEQERLIELLQEKRQAVISHAVTKGLNPNAPMKDSGVEWLGEVPEHWEVKPLKHLATVQTGMAKGKDMEGVETAEVPYLRVANVQDGYLDLEEVYHLTVPIASIDRYLLKKGDVLMNEGGDFDKLGRGCMWAGEIEPCVHQNHVFAVRPHSVSGVWLNAYTSSKAANNYFISRSKQSTNLASISSTNLMGLSVPVPPSEEATEILGYMSDRVQEIDDLRSRAAQAIDLLQERRSALISSAVTGQIDVRGMAQEVAA